MIRFGGLEGRCLLPRNDGMYSTFLQLQLTLGLTKTAGIKSKRTTRKLSLNITDNDDKTPQKPHQICCMTTECAPRRNIRHKNIT